MNSFLDKEWLPSSISKSKGPNTSSADFSNFVTSTLYASIIPSLSLSNKSNISYKADNIVELFIFND